jgi:hypothetical protein
VEEKILLELFLSYFDENEINSLTLNNMFGFDPQDYDKILLNFEKMENQFQDQKNNDLLEFYKSKIKVFFFIKNKEVKFNKDLFNILSTNFDKIKFFSFLRNRIKILLKPK